MVGVLGAAIDVEPALGLRDEEVAAHVDSVLDAIPDWTGTFYKFSLPRSAVDAISPRERAQQSPPRQRRAKRVSPGSSKN